MPHNTETHACFSDRHDNYGLDINSDIYIIMKYNPLHGIYFYFYFLLEQVTSPIDTRRGAWAGLIESRCHTKGNGSSTTC